MKRSNLVPSGGEAAPTTPTIRSKQQQRQQNVKIRTASSKKRQTKRIVSLILLRSFICIILLCMWFLWSRTFQIKKSTSNSSSNKIRPSILEQNTATTTKMKDVVAITTSMKQSTVGINSKLKLRYDYTKLERLSKLAKDIEIRQNDCSVPKRGEYYHNNGSGLGSEIHLYSIVLCTAMEMKNVRLVTKGNWIYNAQQYCSTSKTHSSMSCYFPHAEPYCANDEKNGTTLIESSYLGYTSRYSCPTITEAAGGHSNVRAATTEYLFTRVSSIVQQEGERQLNQLFGGLGRVPDNLITVHIRWGDKDQEMAPVPIQNYTNAIQEIIDQRITKRRGMIRHNRRQKKQQQLDDDEVHVLLCTEDPEVVKHFMATRPDHWKIYIDQYYLEMLPYRLEMGNIFNVNSYYTDKTHGLNGLIALGSLLVAMESNDFVLTTGSNWSRLINEIRKNIIHPRCNNCTTMIDLQYDEI